MAALGLVLIYKTTHVMNFSQGEMAMFSTFFAFTLLNSYGLPYYGAFIGAIAFAAVLGFLVELALMRPLREAPTLSPMIVTLGLIMIVNGVAGWFFGYNIHPFPRAVQGSVINVGGAVISPNSLFILCLSLFIMGLLFWFFKHTMQGLAIRATAQNASTARLMGVNISKVFSITWMVAVGLGATAGILVAPTTNISLAMMGEVHLMSLTAAVMGGFTSFLGPVLGGLILGVLRNLVGAYISTKWAMAFTFSLIIIILLVKPEGLFGKVQRKKV
jgi:branched-chain amino acid transport system permease protein